MTLHFFNPWHDEALASGLSNYTPTLAAGRLEREQWELPRRWAKDGDIIYMRGQKISPDAIDNVDVWGWDKAVVALLQRAGVPRELMPDDMQLETIRTLSHRATAAALLPHLQTNDTVGRVWQLNDKQEVLPLIKQYEQIVLKAPWSCSGRGVRFVSVDSYSAQMQGWTRGIIAKQGSIMAEPHYHKLQDFGVELRSTGGHIDFLGLSIFNTTDAFFKGCQQLTETAKRDILAQLFPISIIDQTINDLQILLDATIAKQYQGLLGVDMMIVATPEGNKLHPLVEINLRRTMGHVSLGV